MKIYSYQDLADLAAERGACSLALRRLETARDFAILFFSPQGREFCQTNHFPEMQHWLGLSHLNGDALADENIFIM